MGLIAKLKKMFNKNIECGDELEGHFIYLYPNSNRVVYVGATIVVDDNHYVVFVCNDRVTDVLPSGKHKISGAVLPKTFSKLKLDRPNNSGNYPKKFKADVYFVYKEVMQNQKFCSLDKFIKKSQHFGKVKGYTEGLCDVRVIDPEILFKILLIDRYYIPNKKGIELTLGLVGNEVNKLIESPKISFTDTILSPAGLKDYLNSAINDRVEHLGVQVENVEVGSFKLNKTLQKRIALFLSERKQYEEEFEQSGIKYTAEQIIPNKVDISAPVENNYEGAIQQPMNTNQPQIIRRGGLNMDNNMQQNPQYKAEINSSDIFGGANKKVCKFCNETIDGSYQFCPRCGFKQ